MRETERELHPFSFTDQTNHLKECWYKNENTYLHLMLLYIDTQPCFRGKHCTFNPLLLSERYLALLSDSIKKQHMIIPSNLMRCYTLNHPTLYKNKIHTMCGYTTCNNIKFQVVILCITSTFTLRVNETELKKSSFLFHMIFLVKTCTLLIMQLSRRQLGQRFRCVMLAEANVASSHQPS